MKSNIRAMKFKTRAITPIRIGAAAAVMGLVAVAAAGGSASIAATTKAKRVTITVASLVPGASAAATKQFNNQVLEFDRANPGIQVLPVTYDWTGPTFAAELAAGTLPTMFTVPFTDGRSLGEAGQLANLTKYAKSYSWFKQFNPAVIAEGIDAKGQVIAIPEAAYAQALQYNRQLFSEAGLNPNKPPTTWAQVAADAQAISAKTGEAGFSVMGANDNTAGWILTTLSYAFGGRVETGIGAKATATFDNPGTVDALNFIHTLRWTDNAMGSNFGLSWGTSNAAFAAGQIGMFVSGSDVYTNMVQADNLNPSIYGLAPLPTENANAGILGGGTLAAVKPTATPAQIAAAMKWINFYYMQPLVNKAQAIRNAKSLIADDQPVGVPAMPVFNLKTFNEANKWIKSLINTPQSQFAPFNDGIFKDKLVPEPESATQAIYGDLDSVVEQVLTNANANIPGLLQAANSVGQSSIAEGNQPS
jgi:ABC-type glycerol-3-phosphate transport system substrate-binding protein